MNDHLIHNEDLIFYGEHFAKTAVKNLEAFYGCAVTGRLGGMNFSLKYDGIAVFVGVDPADGKFFVSNKAFLNKTPKLYKSIDEIDSATMNQDLKNRLVELFNAYCGSDMHGKIYQGDLMYIRDDFKLVYPYEDSKTPYLTFHANTLVYGVDMGNPLADNLLQSRLGVAWHTEYDGDSITSLTSSSCSNYIPVWGENAHEFWVGIDKLFTRNVHILSYYKRTIDDLYKNLNNDDLVDIMNKISLNEKLIKRIIIYNNKTIRDNKSIKTFVGHALEFLETLPQEYHDSNKIEVMQWAQLFLLYKLLQDIKNDMLESFEVDNPFKVFLKLDNGAYTRTSHEGFVLQWMGNTAVKIVNRNEFSYANFSKGIAKAWQK